LAEMLCTTNLCKKIGRRTTEKLFSKTPSQDGQFQGIPRIRTLVMNGESFGELVSLARSRCRTAAGRDDEGGQSRLVAEPGTVGRRSASDAHARGCSCRRLPPRPRLAETAELRYDTIRYDTVDLRALKS